MVLRDSGDFGKQNLRLERFGHKAVHAGGGAVPKGVVGAVCGLGDDGNGSVGRWKGADETGRGQPARLRYVKVHQDQIEGRCLGQPQCFGSVRSQRHRVPGPFENAADDVPDDFQHKEN